MSRIPHGNSAHCVQAGMPSQLFPTAPPVPNYDYLFPALQDDPTACLPAPGQSPAATVAALKALGQSMRADDPPKSSALPAIYTYFGQFISHEITFENKSNEFANFDNAELMPLKRETILSGLVNLRTPRFDLDSLYGTTREINAQLRDGDRMKLGRVTPVGERPVGITEGHQHDLPRLPPSLQDRERHCAALIGDPRNDENLLVAQLHLAFLRAHNTLIERGLSYSVANLQLRQHFQWLVVHDFLLRVTDPDILRDLLKRGANRFYRPAAGALSLPLEFSVAAYRFGHSMVRGSYRINSLFAQATLEQLFRLTAARGNLDPVAGEPGFETLPENWVVEWQDFLDGGANRAQPFDTHLVNELAHLTDLEGNPLPVEASLAVRNLLRGYLLHLPTGQAVARQLELKLERSLVLTPAQIEAAVGPAQAAVLQQTGLSTHTPLWYYTLAEAAHFGGKHLGPVGSTLVAEVLLELVRQSEDSILRQPGWRPSLGDPVWRFTLRDLLRLGGVLSSVPPVGPDVVVQPVPIWTGGQPGNG